MSTLQILEEAHQVAQEAQLVRPLYRLLSDLCLAKKAVIIFD